MLHRGLVILLALFPASSAFTVGRSPAPVGLTLGGRSAAATSTSRLYSDTENFRDGSKKKKVRSDSADEEATEEDVDQFKEGIEVLEEFVKEYDYDPTRFDFTFDDSDSDYFTWDAATP